MVRRFIIFALAIFAGAGEMYSMCCRPVRVPPSRVQPRVVTKPSFTTPKFTGVTTHPGLYQRTVPSAQQQFGARQFSGTKTQRLWTGGKVEGEKYIPRGIYIGKIQRVLKNSLSPEHWKELLQQKEITFPNENEIKKYINIGSITLDYKTEELEYIAQTPLQSIIRAWGKLGADLNMIDDKLKSDLHTLWHLQYKVVDALLKLGADPNLSTPEIPSYLGDIKISDTFSKFNDGPLATAVSENNPGAVKRLLEAGANPFETKSFGISDLVEKVDYEIKYYRSDKRMEKASAELIKRLLEKAREKVDEQEALEQYETLD